MYCGRRRTQRAYLGKAVGKRQIACFRQGRRRDTVLREAFRGLRQRGADKKRFQKRGSVPRGKRAETGRDFDGLGYFKSSDRRKIKRIFVYEPGFRFGYANGQNPKSDCERNTERIRRRKIFEIVRDYGEEKFASKIAKNIVAFRTVQPIETTGQLNDIIDASIPLSVRKKGGHPAKRTYQALRIAVNGELDGLGEAIKELALSLRVGGRMVVLSFHSLEDRIVKQTFKELEADCVCDKNAPICVCGKRREIKILTKPVSPDKSEIDDNPRAASAKLRACERV